MSLVAYLTFEDANEYLSDAEVAEKLAAPNVAEIMAGLNYGDDTWNPEEDIND